MSEVESSGLESVDGYERLTFLGRGGTATLYSARRSSDDRAGQIPAATDSHKRTAPMPCRLAARNARPACCSNARSSIASRG